MALSIRRMSALDLPTVASLSGQLGYAVVVPELTRRFHALAADPNHGVFVAELDGRVAGWIHVFEQRLLESEPYAELGGLVVDAMCRRRGLGRALVEEARRWVVARKLGSLRVRSNVAREEAHQFYPALGFTVLRTQRVYGQAVEP